MNACLQLLQNAFTLVYNQSMYFSCRSAPNA